MLDDLVGRVSGVRTDLVPDDGARIVGPYCHGTRMPGRRASAQSVLICLSTAPVSGVQICGGQATAAEADPPAPTVVRGADALAWAAVDTMVDLDVGLLRH
ncbi:hypothetical protein OG528_31500 [Streptomyces platensis]|uniref:hypothetical protein n=1 Tax=Streptomyces platensis TaxID=58346 RepID=UPI0030E50A8B